MRRGRSRRIALLLGQDLGYCREVLAGVLQYEETHHASWQFRDGPPDRRLLRGLELWKPDGIVGHLFDPDLAKAIVQTGIPCVNTTRTLVDLNLPTIDVDNRAVGALAADYFLEKGFRNFAYFGSAEAQFSAERFEGFRTRLRESGFDAVWLKAEFRPRPPIEKSWDFPGRSAERWLRFLPKPVALLASNDLPARHLTLECARLGISVPEEIAIMGVDNDDAECRMAVPPLSSIAIPSRKIGYEAARMLDGLLSRRRSRPNQPDLQPIGVIERSSSEVLAVDDPVIRKAMRFITESATERIDVQRVARAAGVSRRTLENRTRGRQSQSVLALIHAVRIRHARRLLVESELSITGIAERAGFSSLRQFERIFVQALKQTPRQFRLSNLPG